MTGVTAVVTTVIASHEYSNLSSINQWPTRKCCSLSVRLHFTHRGLCDLHVNVIGHNPTLHLLFIYRTKVSFIPLYSRADLLCHFGTICLWEQEDSPPQYVFLPICVCVCVQSFICPTHKLKHMG